ncbi:hypothetical protein [Lacibacter sediminis]|uniref:Outer membrane beta-barrel protein n=1 Tax=Lacibacter sediminis TaxID=2760713 RepID=A0A7G5XMA3_9BACT|nr:hypothetical protein [Lacibacter sediminis]QNA46606.1 hypothetical protein H4075_10680 [Lacibacter sediminis]
MSQFREEKTDSLEYYQRKVKELRTENTKVLMSNAGYREAIANMNRLSAKTDNYGSFTLFTSVVSADFSKFNNDHTPVGFSPLSGQVWGIGFGLSYKKKRRIFDLDFGTVGIRKRSTKANEEIRSSFLTLFQFEWGYDLTRSNRFNIYPYAGFGFRTSYINYSSGERNINPNATNLSEIVINSRGGVSGDQNALSLQAGLGLETVLTKPSKNGGVILFAKAGTNQAVGSKPIDFSGVKYDPQLKYGNIDITIGFKFFGR